MDPNAPLSKALGSISSGFGVTIAVTSFFIWWARIGIALMVAAGLFALLDEEWAVTLGVGGSMVLTDRLFSRRIICHVAETTLLKKLTAICGDIDDDDDE